MNLDKYTLPNFFIQKKKKALPGTFDLSGNVFYATKMENDEVRIAWGVNINYPYPPDMIHQISTIGNGRYRREYFEKNYYHINKLDGWKKHAIIKAMFAAGNKDVINEV